jgi:hypothetical protein
VSRRRSFSILRSLNAADEHLRGQEREHYSHVHVASVLATILDTYRREVAKAPDPSDWGSIDLLNIVVTLWGVPDRGVPVDQRSCYGSLVGCLRLRSKNHENPRAFEHLFE